MTLPYCIFMCNMYDALTLIHEYRRGIQCIRMYWFLLLSHIMNIYMNKLCSSLWNLKLLTGFCPFLCNLPVFLFILFPTLCFFFQRGIRFNVHVEGPSRGYILEVFNGCFELPSLGPIGMYHSKSLLTKSRAEEIIHLPSCQRQVQNPLADSWPRIARFLMNLNFAF